MRDQKQTRNEEQWAAYDAAEAARDAGFAVLITPRGALVTLSNRRVHKSEVWHALYNEGLEPRDFILTNAGMGVMVRPAPSGAERNRRAKMAQAYVRVSGLYAEWAQELNAYPLMQQAADVIGKADRRYPEHRTIYDSVIRDYMFIADQFNW